MRKDRFTEVTPSSHSPNGQRHSGALPILYLSILLIRTAEDRHGRKVDELQPVGLPVKGAYGGGNKRDRRSGEPIW